jgi:hypothetical protein
MRVMRLPRPVAPALAAAVALLFTGCKPDDDIRAYTAPKEPTAKTEKPAATDDKYRMLGAVIPADDKYFWSVKLVGPAEVVTPLAPEFTAFVQSIKAGNDSNAVPTFTPPAGWESVPPTSFRYATFTKSGVEMYLSRPASGGMLANVNRWRKEVGLRELKEAELNGTLTEVKLGDKTAYTVDLRGPSWSGGMGGGKGPFQK